MVMQRSEPAPSRRFRYLESLRAIRFPESLEVPETQEHLLLRTILYQLLSDEFGARATVCSDQFVYLDAEDPSQVLAPDVCLRWGPPGPLVRTWKVWERGAPELAVELVSDSDASESAWQAKLQRYRRSGVRELVRFDCAATERALRVWDRVEGALVEREVTDEVAESLVLGCSWRVAPADELPRALRLQRGAQLLPTRLEAKQAEQRAREHAEARIAELEAALQRRR
jgi:Uma2 family endonuclease